MQRTRWHSASGTVTRWFDDVLIAATTKVNAKHLDELEPWPLPDAGAYRPEFLAGHETLRYDVEPEIALVTAKGRMAPAIRQDCRNDIGGDEQRVHSVDIRYDELTFKLILLPVWIACYLHAGRTYNIVVNGRTGEVTGERPYSAMKIAAAIALIAAVVVLLRLKR